MSGPMKLKRNTIAAAILTASLIASYAYASDATPSAKKHPVTKKAKAPAKPSVEDQLQTLRQALESQGPRSMGSKAISPTRMRA